MAFDMELREHLAAMRQLARVGAAPADLTEIFRHAHSLKGAARTVDVRPIETVAHRLESLFDRIQKGRVPLDDTTLATIEIAIDLIEDLASDASIDIETSPALAALGELIARADAEAGTGTPAASDVPAPGTAPADAPAPAAPAAATTPPDPAPAPSPPAPPTAEPVAPVAAAPVVLPSAPAPAPPSVPVSAPPAAPAPPREAEPPPQAPAIPHGGDEIVRVRSAQLDQLTAIGGQLLARTGDQTRLGEDLAGLEDEITRLARDWAQMRLAIRHDLPHMAKAAVALVDAMDKGLATLSRRAGQMVRTQGHDAWRLRQLVEALQDGVQQTRVVPAEEVFSGFGRMVRELSRETGRPVTFVTTGLSLEADRMILQALKDPLMHVLRNAIGHGAHTPVERTAAGLSGDTRLEMALSIDGQRLHVRVTDDGRGLDFPRIRETAIAHALLTESEAAVASEADLARLLLRDGFSTARAVDTLSGRGIGLAVLQDMVARLQGDLDIGPAKPRGTQVVVTVPLSVARHNLLLVGVADQTYALPAHSVDRMLRVRTGDLQSVEGQPYVEAGGHAIPLIALSRLIGRPDAAPRDDDGHLNVAVIRTGSRRLALAVDRLIDVRQASVESRQSGRNPIATGSVLLDGDMPVLVLNPAVLSQLGQGGSTGPLAVSAPKHKREAPRVLVVDDSITTRTLEKSILEAEGFRVLLAVDGIDALDLLRREPVELVISDVQMPRLDGFGLLRAVRSDPALAKLPLILVTSVDHPDEVRRGLDLGADAYIIKQRFDQRELLDTIGQFVEAP